MQQFTTHSHRMRWTGVIVLCLIVLSGCSSTKHLLPGQYLLRSNNLKLRSDRKLTNKGELNETLNSLIIQKPNTYFLGLPYKVWLYNARYKHYLKDTAAENFQKKLRAVERPVVYDSLLREKTVQHLKSYLLNQGYFYNKVSDTTTFGTRKAKVFYNVETGMQYLVNKTTLDIDDSAVLSIVQNNMDASVYHEGKPFAMTLADEERSRIANLLLNRGYYKFSPDNIHIEVDTFNKAYIKGAENPFESAINFLALQKNERKPTADIRIIIRKGDQALAYKQYRIGRVKVYPDFVDRKDVTDSTMYESEVNDITFRYHNYYVREKVLLEHIFMLPGDYYNRENHDLTITKLNELGLFQFTQIYFIEDSTLPEDQSLRCVILMNPTKRYDFSANLEVSNGSTYVAGFNGGLNFRNRNFMRGANQLSISLTGGIEMGYSKELGNTFVDHFYMLSRNAGVNATIDFPKFIAPFSLRNLGRKNQPRTILGLGTSLLERVDYFTLINSSASITYNWRQNSTNTWDLSPAFINVLRLPSIADTFQKRLATNDFLRNSYKENFIEGENIFFTYSNQNGKNARRHYSYIKAGFEESGALLGVINNVVNLKNSLGLNFSQYFKLEGDARHYFRTAHTTLAGRIFTGIGIPYDKSSTLPYIKQYFVGGPYSLRGWRVRQLGPGSYYNADAAKNPNFIDRTGDIKLEANLEYRFDMFQVFAGALHINGAVFADAGNIWLAQPSGDYPNGEFKLSRLGEDLAVSAGVGARIDISGLFVLRIDEGFPIKNPAYPVNGGWVIDKIKPDISEWRSQNLVLHIAIGYPF